MNWTLEVVLVPVSDIDRAKSFYANQLGFQVDYDTEFSEETRWVQLTPSGSRCSIAIGRGLTSSGRVFDLTPGSLLGLQLVVPDIRAARAQLVERGVEVTEVQIVSANGVEPAPLGADLDNVGFVHFSDPDGNEWAVQQISSRANDGRGAQA